MMQLEPEVLEDLADLLVKATAQRIALDRTLSEIESIVDCASNIPAIFASKIGITMSGWSATSIRSGEQRHRVIDVDEIPECDWERTDALEEAAK